MKFRCIRTSALLHFRSITMVSVSTSSECLVTYEFFINWFNYLVTHYIISVAPVFTFIFCSVSSYFNNYTIIVTFTVDVFAWKYHFRINFYAFVVIFVAVWIAVTLINFSERFLCVISDEFIYTVIDFLYISTFINPA